MIRPPSAPSSKRVANAHPDFEVTGAAATAEQAIGWRATHRPDVITLDIEMPGMNGLEFLEQLMAEQPTPVVMLSSHTPQGAEPCARAKALGAHASFNKANVLAQSKALLKLVRAAASHPVDPPHPI